VTVVRGFDAAHRRRYGTMACVDSTRSWATIPIDIAALDVNACSMNGG
jgi:hypothetical protein